MLNMLLIVGASIGAGLSFAGIVFVVKDPYKLFQTKSQERNQEK